MDFTTLPFIFQHSLSMNIQVVLLHEPGNNFYFFTQNFLCISLSFSLSPLIDVPHFSWTQVWLIYDLLELDYFL